MAREKDLRAKDLLREMLDLREAVYSEGQATFAAWCPRIERRATRISCLNLAHYLALRERDLRDMQNILTSLGLSSLGRSEARVLPNLDAVIATLGEMTHTTDKKLPERPSLQAFYRGERMLERNARNVLGAAPSPRRIRIMVTLPTEAATNDSFVSDLLKRGMDWARINCVHDDQATWEGMIANIRKGEKQTGKTCKILMDLGGPKARTGDVMKPEKHKRLFAGDRVLLVRKIDPNATNTDEYPFQVECQLPQVFDQLREGMAVWFDDGRVGMEVEAITAQGIILRVAHVEAKGAQLKSDKGLNFPDADLHLSPLTDKDRLDLPFVASRADAIGYSYVQSAADVEMLQKLLASECRRVAIIAKVETAKAIHNLPEIIVQGMGKQPFGVMIARGDLAVEIGYERMAEMQEELLWLCEAAHVPVIWATQVLENFVKKGIPSRAEMTDAAMAERAECVMLNKGPYVADAVTILDNVLVRMQAHQNKKTAQLRALHAWQ